MKCKPYSEITVEIRTQLKTVKITSNIFAVQLVSLYLSGIFKHYLTCLLKSIKIDRTFGIPGMVLLLSLIHI